MADEIMNHFQVLGEILLQYLTEQGMQHQGDSATGVATWVPILLKNDLELLKQGFSSEAGKQLEWSKAGSISSFRKILDAECSGSQSWVNLCSFETSLEGSTKEGKVAVVQRTVEQHIDACDFGRTQEETVLVSTDFPSQTTPMELKESSLTPVSPSSGVGAAEGFNFDNAHSDFAFPTPEAGADLEPEDSPNCFIKRETLEALRQEHEGSEAESPTTASPDRSKQSPWKSDSPRTFVYSPRVQNSPGGFWDNLRQGSSERALKQWKESWGDGARTKEAPLSLRVGTDSVACPGHAKPSSKLLRMYMKSASKAKSLCTFLEAAGPLSSADISKVLAWSGLLSITALTLRMKTPHRPELRYLLRVVEDASDPGWPVTPTTLLALREKLQSFADGSLHAQLRQKEKILVKSLADGIGSMVRTVLEWYYLHLSARVEAALEVAPVKVRSGPQGESELLSANEIRTCFVSAAQRRYTQLKGHANKISKQILLACLTRNITVELRDQMQRYPFTLYPEHQPVRTASATFCQNLLEELRSLEACKALELNRDFFTLLEAFLGLDAVSKDALEQDPAELLISSTPQQELTSFLMEVCKVLEPYVSEWISSVSDQLLRWDQSLVVSLAKQAPAPGSKSRTSRSLKDLFDGILRIAGSDNARLVYKSAPHYAALLDKALCRVILNRMQAIHVLCEKALSQATKQYHLPLPPALKKWRLPATGPLLSPNVCVLLNDLREVRSRLSTLLIELSTPLKDKLSETSTPTSVLGNMESPAVERVPPKPSKPSKASMTGRSPGGFFSRLWSVSGASSTGKSKARHREEAEKSERLTRKALQWNGDDKQEELKQESRTRRAKSAPRSSFAIEFGERAGVSSAYSSGASTPRSRSERKTSGDMGGRSSLFREIVVRSLSGHEKTPHKKPDGNMLLRMDSARSEPKLLDSIGELTANGSARKAKSQGLNGLGRIKAGSSSTGTRTPQSGPASPRTSVGGASPRTSIGLASPRTSLGGASPPEPDQLWVGEGKQTVSTSEERFAVLRMEIEKEYFELVRAVAHTIAQDFGPFLEAVISGPDHIPFRKPGPSDPRQGAASDFGLALDARRRMKPLLDYLRGTFQEGWKLLDRSVLRRLAQETWDASAEALLSLLPSFHGGASTNIAGRPQGPQSEDDDLSSLGDAVSVDLSAFDVAAPRMRKVGAIAAHFEEVFGELIVSTGGSATDARKKSKSGTAVPASEVPRNVRRLSELLNAFASSGSAASWSSGAYAR